MYLSYLQIYSDGAFTSALEELDEGSTIEVSLPEGIFTHDKVTAATVTASDVALLGAGTGITPMIRVMLAALNNKNKVHLILFNKTEADIPWKEELDNLAEDQSSLLKVTHVLSQPSDSWTGLTGRIRKDLLETLLEISSKEKAYFCLCGPTVFTKLGVDLLKEHGYKREDIHAFLG